MIDEEVKNFYRRLGVLLKNARVSAGYKQEYVAFKLGLKRTSIANIEKGNQKIQVHSFLQVCELLEIDIYDLLPNLTEGTSLGKINTKDEEKLSKEISKEVDNKKEAFDILVKFIESSKLKK